MTGWQEDMQTLDVPLTLKVEEAAKVLGIGRQTAYDLAAQGKLPGARRLGRRIVVSRKALEDFLADDSGLAESSGHRN